MPSYFRRDLPALLLLCAFLAGCSMAPTGDSSQGSGEDRLINARDRLTAVCRSTRGLTDRDSLEDIVFSCPSLGVKATLEDIRDAGWRLESVDVGEETNSDGAYSLPLKITVRKLL